MYHRRNIFLRAHQLHNLNRARAGEVFVKSRFVWALKHAWSEAKAGTLPSFAPAAIAERKVTALRNRLVFIEAAERLRACDYAEISALGAELAQMAA